MTSPLHDRLVSFTSTKVDALVAAHLPGFRIPRIFAGHPVAPDVRADLAFTLGLLGASGIERAGGLPIEDALEVVLAPTDGAGTHSFFSYRVAETLLRYPALLERFGESTREVLFEACDSTSFLPRLTAGELPRNYAAVLLRCEAARARLDQPVDQEVLHDLTTRTVALLDGNPGGYLDDSQSRIGRYDIYSGDIYLFTEPVADRLGAVWRAGARSALDLVDRIAATNGAAFTWGRSIGALSTCLTIELAGLATGHDLVDDPSRWLARGEHAFDHIDRWFADDGVITAHQYRSTFGYRGPFRRLQMTLDCLGKLADTALVLQRADGLAVPVAGEHDPFSGEPDLFPPRDELIAFETDRPAAVWTYRSRDLAFVLPLVGSTVGDYLPTPRNPGLFEVPVDTDLPTGVPTVFREGRHHTSGDLPTSVEKAPGGLVVTYDGFPRSRRFERDETEERLPGTRRVDYRVEGRTLHVTERLTFAADALPDAIALQVSETAGRPLRIRFRTDTGHAATVIDVSGLKEYRSFWAELPTVHQLDLDPAPELTFGWTVTPKLRVLTTGLTHHYHRSIYDPLVEDGAVVDRQISTTRLFGEDGYLDGWDVFHLHWPEWFLGPDVGRHRSAVERLQSEGVRIVWTQHNLVPHDKDPRLPAIYDVWAGAADGVVHHSEYGRRRVEERYGYRTGAEHRVIPHPHFGHLFGGDVPAERLGPIRLGILGAPRMEKNVQSVIDAFAATTRDDLELAVWSLGPGDVVPDDPRITAESYRMVDRALYDKRLRSLDALVLPFTEADMITTGTIGDVVGAGIAALVSDWGYLTESLGDAGIPYGDDLTGTLERLDRRQLADAAASARSRRPSLDHRAVAEQHLALLEAVGTTRL